MSKSKPHPSTPTRTTASAAERFARAVERFNAGQAAEAAALCEPIVQAQPGHAQAWQLLGMSRIVDGRPDGDVAPWQDLKFPFASSLRGTRLDGAAVRRLPEPGPEVEEVYSCSDAGAVSVTIRVPADGFARTWRLGRPVL